MTKAEAHRLLDAARAGAVVSELEIITALRATGDLAPLRLCSRRDTEGQPAPFATFAEQRQALKAAGKRAHLPEAA